MGNDVKAQAAYLAVQYAQRLGHTNIGYLAGQTKSPQHYESYLRALSDLQLLKQNHPVLPLADTLNEANQATVNFLRHRPHDFRFPSLFIAPSDAIALGAMKAFRDFGYHIPEDISFIGFGNAPEGATFEPSLTTIDSAGNLIERESVYDIR